MKITKKQITNLFFVIGVLAVVVMFFTFDVSFVELWDHIKHAGWWLVPILGVWLIIYAMNALAWKWITNSGHRDGVRVGFWYIYKHTISGFALNYATPMGGLGGEPYRIVELSKRVGLQRATSSVVLYVMTHFLAHFSFWFFSLFVYVAMGLAGLVPMTTPVIVVLCATFAACLGAFYLFSRGYQHGMVRRLITLVGKLPGLHRWSARFLDKHADDLRNIDEQIAALHQQDRRTFRWSLAMEFLARLSQSFEIMFMLLLFGIDNGGGAAGLSLTFVYSVLTVAITTLCANILGFLPLQLGVQEGGFVVSIALLGIAPAVGIFVSIICRVREIFWIFVGLVLMKTGSDGSVVSEGKVTAAEVSRGPEE